MDGSDTRSLPQLVAGLTGDLATLVRKEGELVRTEVTEKLHKAVHAGQGLALGGALLLGAFLVLLQALVLALSQAMDPLWASVLVGVVLGLAGYLTVKSAAKHIQPSALAPDRAGRQLRKDAQLMKEQVR